MNRYSKSFLFSFGIYFFIFIAFGLSANSFFLKNKAVDNDSVKITLCATPNVTSTKPQLVQQVEQPLLKPKTQAAPIIEKEAEKIIEKPVEKPVEKIAEKIIEKPIVQPTKRVEIEPQIHQKVDVSTNIVTTKQTLPTTEVKSTQKQTIETPPHKIVKSEQNTQEIQNKKREYFALVKNTIDKYKYYPQNALRRGIECEMKVKFTISSMGELLSFEMIEGNKMFHNSVKEAIEKSFPLLPPKNILAENEVLSLVISYAIN